MIGRALTDSVSPTVFATMMPPRAPVDSFCKIALENDHHRLRNATLRSALAVPPTRTRHAVPTTFASAASANAQIPIALRPC
jgi:hypothetical protein